MPLLQKYYKALQKYYFYITEYCRLLYAEIYKGRKPKFSPFIVLILTVLPFGVGLFLELADFCIAKISAAQARPLTERARETRLRFPLHTFLSLRYTQVSISIAPWQNSPFGWFSFWSLPQPPPGGNVIKLSL